MDHDWRSKLLDTPAMGMGIVVVHLALLMLLSFFDRIADRLGVIIFVFVLLMIAIFFLERATILRFPDAWRARSGILAGLTAWVFVSGAWLVGGQEISNTADALILVMVILICVTLWRRVFSTGVQFFAITFLFAWMGRIILTGFDQLQNGRLITYHVFTWAAIVFGILSLGVVAWSLLRSRSRIQRLLMAVMLWFCLMVVIFSLRGGTF